SDADSCPCAAGAPAARARARASGAVREGMGMLEVLLLGPAVGAWAARVRRGAARGGPEDPGRGAPAPGEGSGSAGGGRGEGLGLGVLGGVVRVGVDGLGRPVGLDELVARAVAAEDDEGDALGAFRLDALHGLLERGGAGDLVLADALDHHAGCDAGLGGPGGALDVLDDHAPDVRRPAVVVAVEEGDGADGEAEVGVLDAL